VLVTQKRLHALGYSAIATAILGMILYLNKKHVEEFFLLQRVPLHQEYRYSFGGGPPFTEHFLQLPDGGRINLLWFTAPERGSTDPRKVIVYYHGNSDNLARWGVHAKTFAKYGYDLIIYDFRGYGKSTGRRSEATLLQDADSIYAFAKRRYAEKNILVYGRSLGTGLAAHVAAAHAPAQLILETPYNNLVRVARYHIPLLPEAWPYAYTLRTDEVLGRVRCPITILHGTNDAVVPYASAAALKPLLTAGRDTFITLAGAGHRNLNTYEVYHSALARILTHGTYTQH